MSEVGIFDGYGEFDSRLHRTMIKTILACDDYHAERVHRLMGEIVPELDRLTIPSFTALCQQAGKEVRHAA